MIVRAELKREIRGRAALGPSRDQVDDAACAAATEQDGGRALDDLDPLDVVEIAEPFLVVPNAVDEEVRRGADAAQHDLVAVAFSLRDRDARHVPHRVSDGLRVLIDEKRLRHDVDRLRDVAQRRVGLGGAVDSIGR